MRSLRFSMPAAAATLLGGVLLALAGCGPSQPSLPSFPEYPPAKAYLKEQAQLKEEVQAHEAYEAHVRLVNQIRAAERADEMWQRTEALKAQREREQAFREAIRRYNEQRHFQELQEFQSLQ